MSVFQDFKAFAMRGNVVDMAVGIIIGGAFGTIVKSLVEDVIMPPIGLLLGNMDFSELFLVLRQGTTAAGPYATVAAAKEAGAVTLNYGMFITNVVSFLIVAFAVFMLVRVMMRIQHPRPIEAAKTKECPYCLSAVALKASRCPQCTSQLGS